jgi:sulfide:quinone oxidoreductase
VPVLVNNINQLVEGKELNAKYNGYSSCPLFVGDKKLLLAEFKYGGVPHETFSKNQDTPATAYYYLKKEAFPRVYFNLAAKGLWYGNKTIFKPKF